MSEERYLSFDHAKVKKRNPSIKKVYVLEKSPNRVYSPLHVTNMLNICDRKCGRGNGIEHLPIDDAELLDDFEEPTFCEPPDNLTFDELTLRILNSSFDHQLSAPTASESLDTFRTEVANVLYLDDLRKRVEIDDVRQRIAPAVTEKSTRHSPHERKTSTLTIPSPPRNPKDMLAIIRRARAIARIKALEDEKVIKKPKVDASGNIVKGIKVKRKRLENMQTLWKSKNPPTTKLTKNTAPQKTIARTKKKNQLEGTQHTPDQVSEQWAAAILRTRRLAGLKTTNPKLIPKTANVQVPKLKENRLTLPSNPKTLTFDNIVERVTAIRSRTNLNKTTLAEVRPDIVTQTPQDILDEFEILEELYAAKKSSQNHAVQQTVNNLQQRIKALQKDLFQSSPLVQNLSRGQHYGAEISRDMATAAQRVISRSPVSTAKLTIPQQSSLAIHPPIFDNAYLQNIDMPEFDVKEIPEIVFSAGALADAGFEIEDEVSVGEISMPEFDEDISLDELGIEDITTPKLYDLSISYDELAIEPDYPLEISTGEDEAHFTEREENQKEPGFLTSIANIVLDTFKNLFSASDVQKELKEIETDLDTSLPNMFKITPPQRSKTPQQKKTSYKGATVIPPHPKDPKDYKGMVKRAQAIQKKKSEEFSLDTASASQGKEKRSVRKTQLQKKKNERNQEKSYSYGEYSPTDVKAVGRVRSLGGLKNLSAQLNVEAVAKIAQRKAVREAYQHIEPSKISFLQDFVRVFNPAKDTQKKKGSKAVDVMSPITKDTQVKEDLMQFSPLKPHEVEIRIRYLKDQTARRIAETIKAAEEKQAVISFATSPSRQTQEIPPFRLSPIEMQNPKMKKIRNEKHISEDLANIEPPEFFNLPDVLTPNDPTIPNPAEIINRIRSNVHHEFVSAQVVSPESSSPTSPGIIEFPHNLTNEKLLDVTIPEFARTPQNPSPLLKTFQRMHALWEVSQAKPPSQISTKGISPLREPVKHTRSASKIKSPEEQIFIPPHPKDPKDYKAIIKRAQAIEKYTKRVESLPFQTTTGWNRTYKKSTRTRLKKEFPTFLPKKSERTELEDQYKEYSLSKKDIEAIARARLLQGLKNKTAILNPAVTAKLRAEEIAQTTFDALPEVEKIKKRMEKLRKISSQKRRVQPSADILGTLAAIRETMPSLTAVFQYHSANNVSDSISNLAITNRAQVPRKSSDEFVFMEQYMDAEPEGNQVLSPIVAVLRVADLSLEEFANIESELQSEAIGDTDEYHREKFENIAGEAQKLYDVDTPKRTKRYLGRQLVPETPSQPSAVLTKSEAMIHTHILPKQNARFNSIYCDEIEDFRVPAEDIALEASKLMLETPPRNLQDMLQRIKETQLKNALPSVSTPQLEESPITPDVHFSPIKLISPRSGTSVVSGEHEQLASSMSIHAQNELLINIDASTEKVKLFTDLQDMPFDELEYEVEPNLTDVSFDTALSPPPTPSGIISKIRYAYYKNLKERANPPTQKSPEMLTLPKEFPDEELFDISAPTFAQTPKTTPIRYKSPRISFPMAWGEVRSVTPITPIALSPHIPTIIKVPNIRPHQEYIKDNISILKDPIIIPPHPKDPKDYGTMIRRAQAIHRSNMENEAEGRAGIIQPAERSKKSNIFISRRQVPPAKKISIKPIKNLVFKTRVQRPVVFEGKKKLDTQQLPPLPQKYVDAVAKARLLHGLKNRTAILNPKRAAKIAAKKAAEEAFNALPEVEKIKVRMERLRSKPHAWRNIKPTIEHIAYLEALKQLGQYHSHSSDNLAPLRDSLSITHQSDFTQTTKNTNNALSELFNLGSEKFSQTEDKSLAEFEIIEAPDTPHQTQPADSMNMKKLISDLQQQLLTPVRINPRERYSQLIAQRKTFITPVVSPVKTSETHYSPLLLPVSPPIHEQIADKPTTQTRSGNKSEMFDGRLKHFTTRVRSATDPQANLIMQISENPSISARNHSTENLEDIAEPSFLDTTPLTPIDRLRPKYIIERVARQVKEKYRPEVPPPLLPLPTEVPEEQLLHVSYPDFEMTLPPTPPRSPITSPVNSPDISIPQIFADTPPPPIIFHVSALRKRIPSPESPIIIPPHPKESKDYRAMVRAKKIQMLIQHKDAEARIAEDREAIAAYNPKKKRRVPISRWTAPPPGRVKNLITNKRNDFKTLKSTKLQGEIEYSELPQSLPKHFAEEVALARKLAGIKGRPAANVALLRSPIKNYATVLSRIKQMKEEGAIVRGQPSLAAVAYLDALKGAMQVRKIQQNHSPKTRYKRIIAARTVLPPTIEDSTLQIASAEDIPYSPVRFISPSINDNERNSLRPMTVFEVLEQLEELSAFEQPSFLTLSQYTDEDQNMPLTPSPTPPRLSSAIIKRIRQQYEEERGTISPESSAPTPQPLQFPKNLTEEKLFELSAPPFAYSPDKSVTPIRSPDITIPHYFEESPPPVKTTTPAARSRRLVELKSKTAITTSEQIPSAQSSYATIMERYATLRTAKQKVQQVLTDRELTHRQYLINRQQRLERNRLMHELERLRQLEGFQFEPTRTPPTARERLEAIKSRILTERSSSLTYPYSPVKTPEVLNVPQYQPLNLPQTPPYHFLENVDISNIDDTSMVLDDLDNYTIEFEGIDTEDLEFQLMERANASVTEFDKNIKIVELERPEDNFDIGERIEMLRRQLLTLSDKANEGII